MPEFVCEPCRTGDHAACPGGTRCDCGHRQPRTLTTVPTRGGTDVP